MAKPFTATLVVTVVIAKLLVNNLNNRGAYGTDSVPIRRFDRGFDSRPRNQHNNKETKHEFEAKDC